MKIEELQKKIQAEGSYTCAHCKNSYPTNPGWDPVAEATELWGDLSKRDDQEILCDDCFNDFMKYQKMN